MTAGVVAVAGVAVVLGAGAGWVQARRLATHDHRYEDEQDARTLRYGWVPVAMALAAGLVGAGQTHAFGVTQGLVYAALTVPLVVLSAIDLDVHRLPDRWTGPTLVATVLGLSLVAAVRGAWHELLVGAGCALAVGGFYLLLAVIAGGRGFGLGDVKLSPTLALLLGFNGVLQACLGTLLAFFSASVVGIGLIVFAGAGRKTAIPFGPHMVLGCLVVLALPVVGALTA